MLVCFHFVMESSDAITRSRLVRDVLRRIVVEQNEARMRRLKGLLQHAMADYSINLQGELLDPAVARTYEDADLLFNLATGVEAASAPCSEVISGLAALHDRSEEAFVLASFLLVVRLGALPGFAPSGRKYLDHLRERYAETLRNVPAKACAEYAAQFDYGEGFARVLDGRAEATVDVLPLLDRALSLSGCGTLKMRHPSGAEGTSWSKEEVRRASRRFQAWALTHHGCRLLAPILDLHKERSELAQDVARLARWATHWPLSQAVGDMLVQELFVVE